MFPNRIILVIAVIISLAAGFAGGVFITKDESVNSVDLFKKVINQEADKPNNLDFGLFWEVWNSVQEKYVDKNKLDAQKMLYGAIDGMVESIGDPYTVFLAPAISKKFEEEISGSFGGIGIEIGKRNGVLTIISPIKNTPAYNAELKAGDKIAKIDSKSTANMSIEEAVNLIRGKKGTKITLTVVTKESDPRDVTMVRDTIKIPTIEWKLIEENGSKIAYLGIYAFNQNIDSGFKKAAEEILKSDAEKLIVDLRNNPGGLLDSAINLAGWFIDRNEIVVIEEFGNGTKNEFRADGNATLKHYPTLILINGGSASASEILAGAIHDNRKVKLVGEKTFGKGSVQELQKFDNGSSLKVTIAKWLTPAGISISDKGIEADIKVEIAEQDIKDGKIEIGELGKDPQLDKAIELLK